MSPGSPWPERLREGAVLGAICVQPMAVMWCSVTSVGTQKSRDRVEGGEAPFNVVYSGPIAEIWLCVPTT